MVIVGHNQRLKEIADRVLWLEDGQFRELAGMTTDPDCKLALETGECIHAGHDGDVCWFCSLLPR